MSVSQSHHKSVNSKKNIKTHSKVPSSYKTLQEVINDVERDYILHTLELTNWNLQKTSRMLDIARNTLKAKMKKYNIHT